MLIAYSIVYFLFRIFSHSTVPMFVVMSHVRSILCTTLYNPCWAWSNVYHTCIVDFGGFMLAKCVSASFLVLAFLLH